MDIDQIKRLKTLTGVGLTDAKQALEQAGGDFDKALKAMRIKGLAKADKKSEREARAGVVDSYVHSDRIGVIIEVNCETDFVARTAEFKAVVHDLAMQVAAASPQYVLRTDIPSSVVKQETELIRQEVKAQGKSGQAADAMIKGKLEKWYAETALLDQAFIKQPDTTVGEYVKQAIARLGENIVVSKFHRIELGEGS